jgi:hypothetical protein
MSHHLQVEHVSQEMHDCIDRCSDCHDVCLATLVHCLNEGGEHAAAEHIRTLLDCADICDTSRDFMLRGSPLHHDTCRVCAEACDRCAESCERLDGDEMRRCAEECRRCAESCRNMAGGVGH